MSTLTRVDSNSGRKPQYKDYVAFLDNYRNGKKDEINSVTTTDSGVSFSLTNSSNNSSNSVFSDLNGLHEDVERIDTHKFNAIRTSLNKNSTVAKQPRKTVKSEIVIEIKDSSPASFEKTNHVFQIHDLNNASYPQLHQKSNVSEVSKKFEDRRDSESGVKSNIIPGCHIPKEAIGKKNSIGELSKKFEQDKESKPIRNSINQDVEHNKIVNKKATNVTEVSKIFQNNTTTEHVTNKTTIIPKSKVFNNTPKPFVPTNGVNNTVNNGAIKPVLYAAQSSSVNTKPLITSPKPSCLPPKPTFEDMLLSKVSIATTSAVLTPPELPTSYNSSSSPEPPKVCYNEVMVPPAPPLPSQEATFIPPPPPPLPISNLSRSIVQGAATPKVNGVTSHPKVVSQSNGGNNNNLSNGVKVTVHHNGHGGDDLADGKPVDLKKDPRVKKAVYGALRGMYGSYHDKANEFIATLPKNRVKKNNGLDSIIDSIKSQGGLEKLNGRANPDPEVA